MIRKAKNAPRVTLRRCGRVFPLEYLDTTAQIKAAILKYGAVRANILVNSAFQAYKSGVYEDTITDADRRPYYRSESGHAISLIGWDDNPPEGGGGCWILRNSWGTSWGEDGYMRIRYFSAHVNCAAEFIEGSAPGDGERMIQGDIIVVAKGMDVELTTVVLSGSDAFATMANEDGRFFFPTLSPGNYRLTPTNSGYVFVPPYQDVVVTDKDISGIDFKRMLPA